MLGVPGLMAAYRAGRVALANAPGNGVADDKVIYAYVPDMIRYYEGEDPILPNVPTYLCWRDARPQVRAGQSRKAGGEGRQRKRRLRHAGRPAFHRGAARRNSPCAYRPNPRNYIAQPTLALSRVPTIVDDHFEGRHVDLRPYVLCGKDIYVLPGRPHARRHAQGFAGGQLLAGRRQQRHLGAGDAPRPRQRRRSAAITMPQTKPLLSRVADAVYWLGRYIERAENVARFLDVNHNLMLDLPQDYADQWQPIVDTTGDRALVPGTLRRRHPG